MTLRRVQATNELGTVWAVQHLDSVGFLRVSTL
jgi:hypothetical protein